MTQSIYTTTSMLQVVESLRRVPTFLQTMFFPYESLFETEEVAFDVEEDDLRLAPFVAPLVEGKVMSKKGYETTKLKPAYVKPLFSLTPKDVMRRRAGEGVGGELSPAERSNLLLADGLEKQLNMVDRRIEVMCADIIKDGKLTIAGDDYPAVTVDFERHTDLNISLTGSSRWGQSNISPFDDVETWMGKVGEHSGAAVTDIIFGAGAWKHFRADEKTEKAINRELGQQMILNLGLDPQILGVAQFKGTDGTVRYWVYNDKYVDSDGQTKDLFNTDSVTLISREKAVGTLAFGAILDHDSLRAMRYFPKSWLEQNPSVRMLMTQSAPLPFFGRVNATAHALTNNGEG